MTSPARRRFQSAMAAKRGAESALCPHAQNLYEMMMMQLIEHRRILKTVQAMARKLDVKSKFLAEYDAYVDGVLEGNSGVQDEVFVTVMLWHIDVGRIERALTLAAYALKHDLVMPDRFERNLACTVAEEIAETAARLLDADDPVNSELLVATLDLTATHDMFDEVRAKLWRQLGQAYEAESKPDAALDAYQTALKFNPKCGVKKFIERITRELKNANK
ncbi:MAG: phage terminase small subunit [Vibrionaceae bacterium]